MLYTFKSRAASDLIFLEADGRQLLTLMGKDPDAPNGVLTTAQIPAAIAALNAAMAKEAALEKVPAEDEEEADSEDEAPEVVALRQRVVPFIEWLERSLADDHDVMW
ncbi:MAG: DUF1840 family protein [Neisseriaceae bacterium]|nr:DUF1840 family protein [Neisseriaceae bacterium]MBP6861314.1 DUF1840 family protein [Neisseriaceae bacterium]